MIDGKAVIQISVKGKIQLKDESEAKTLSHFAGDWSLGPSTSYMLLFERKQLGTPIETSEASFLGKVLFAGVIEEGSLLEFINFLGENNRSGVLVVVSDGVKKSVFFKEGQIRYATSTDPDDRLGNVLFRYGMVEKDKLTEALSDRSRRLGEKLVQMGVLGISDLYRAIKAQVEEIVYSCFLFTTGSFYFYELATTASLPSHLHLATRNVLMEGVRRMDEMSYFRKKLPGAEVVPEVLKDATIDNLTKQESGILALIDGRCNLEELSRKSHLGVFDTTRIVFHLMQGGIVRLKSTHSMANEASGGEDNIDKLLTAYNQVFHLISAKAEGFTPKLQRDLEMFLHKLDGELAVLFSGVVVKPDLTIDPAQILQNMTRLSDRSSVFSLVYKALDEIFYFLLFSAGISIDSAVETDLQNTIRQLTKQG
ncbi:DUF4388 domain-containing protein [Myxococcota bacterium]|nr:DUF4388 domain-containing protein [Myxococcota bacterium]MBU1409926.1 DUF4388 domain-containing protein [Myxococcota bacterium]MBU1509687.1 DUF4388 domain-containing protein [Myxococcota bacterium]